jgi:hypothetical protein
MVFVRRLVHLLLSALVASTGACIAQTQEPASPESVKRVVADLKQYEAHVAELNKDFAEIPANPRDREWVKKKLKHMFDVDQYMRKYWEIPYQHKYSDKEKKYFQEKFYGKGESLDSENTAELKKLLEIHHWFTISEFGLQADNNAWLLVQHADLDLDFQKKVLKILTDLYPKNETNRSNYAYLYDRVAVADKRPQRYGTQGRCVGPGKWEPHEIEDQANVDARRKEMGLMSMSDYMAGFKDLCH